MIGASVVLVGQQRHIFIRLPEGADVRKGGVQSAFAFARRTQEQIFRIKEAGVAKRDVVALHDEDQPGRRLLEPVMAGPEPAMREMKEAGIKFVRLQGTSASAKTTRISV